MVFYYIFEKSARFSKAVSVCCKRPLHLNLINFKMTLKLFFIIRESLLMIFSFFLETTFVPLGLKYSNLLSY